MDGGGALALGGLALILTPIAAIDQAQRRIPDGWNLGLAGAGLAYALARDPAVSTAAWALARCALVFAILALAQPVVLRRGALEGLGGGDVKFLVAASFWVGLEGGLLVLVLAGLALAATTMLAKGRPGSDAEAARPFGPMLAASLFAVAALAEQLR